MARKPVQRLNKTVSVDSSQKILAIINEDQCIGCTRCIDACPVDAILGSSQYMHTVIAAECIGCKLCVPACPVDCIDLIPTPETQPRIPPEHIKQRYQARQQRLKSSNHLADFLVANDVNKRDYVTEALARMKRKKSG